MKDTKKSKNLLLNILLCIVLLTSISYFVITLIYKEDNIDFLISLLSSLLLCIFTCFFVITEFTNPSKRKAKIYITAILFLIYMGFGILNTLSLLPIKEIQKIEDFTNKSLTEVIKWSEKNHIDINQVYEYSDLVDEYYIISQSEKTDTLLKDIKELTIVVSEGPSPDKEVIIPNMINWEAKKVLEFISKNYLSNVSINFIESDKLRNTLLEQNISGTKKRSDSLELVFSLGSLEELEDVKLMDLSNKSKLEGEFFLKENAIDYEIEYDFSNKIKRGNVIKTDLEVGTMLKPKETKVKLIISKGPKITVPDLTKYNMTEITEWIIKNKLKLEFTDKYDDNIKENKVISANYNKGDVIEQKTLIKIVLSKGKLIMQGFESLDEFKSWANKYGINYEEKYVFNSEVKSGEVISYSHKKGDTIKNDDTIVITISQGAKTTVPNVVGKTKESAIKLLESAKLKYNFVYENSTKSKNKVLKQSLSANNEVAQNTTITLTLSNGKAPTTGSSSNSSNSNNNSNSSNNNNNSGGNNNTPTTPTCDPAIKDTIYIYGELLKTSASETCQSIKSYYSKFKFNCTYINGTGMPSGLIYNSPDINGKSFNYCDTITLKIIQN